MILQERLDLFYKRKEFNNFHLFSGIRWCLVCRFLLGPWHFVQDSIHFPFSRQTTSITQVIEAQCMLNL